MGEVQDVITIYTNVGYAKVICAAETTVKEMIGMAMRTVSLTSSPQLYCLQLAQSTTAKSHLFSRHILCRSLTWAELKTFYGPCELMLSICLYPTKFEEAARNDRSTLCYLHQQTKELYYMQFAAIEDVEMAFEVGCLDIRSVLPGSKLSPKDLIDLVEKVRTLQSFFPPCVTNHYKGRSLRRAVQNYLLKIKHYTEEDCVLDMLNRYLILLQFDRDVIKCSFGAGYGIPAELVIGPRFQVSITVENARQPRLLAYFASIRQVLVSRTPCPDGERFQVRLAIEPSPDHSGPLELITFTFYSQEDADTIVHLLEGYCGESIGAAFHHGSSDQHLGRRPSREEFLPNGCPYRFREVENSELRKVEIPRSNVILEQVLGEGQFGDVYKGVYTKYAHAEPIPVAVKTCKLETSLEDRQQFLEEASILREFSHPHIVRLYGICSEDPIWVIMEYAPFGELRHYLLANQTNVSLSMRITFCYQIVTALTCLEDKKCVHRDIAARNILVAREDWVKLADFGMAKMLQDAEEFRADKGRKMPIKWMPPESIHHRRFSTASDVWMFGVCMWEIITGGVKPFADLTNAEAADLVTRGHRLKRPAVCPSNLYTLMLECWNTNPQLRPSFSSLKPRLRELAAQSRSITETENMNENPSEASEQLLSQLIEEANIREDEKRNLFDQNMAETLLSNPADTPSLIDQNWVSNNCSRWEEVTELEDRTNGRHPITDNTGLVSEGPFSRRRVVQLREGSNRRGLGRSTSVGRADSGRNHCNSNSSTRRSFRKPSSSADDQAARSYLHGVPNLTRDPSPCRRNVKTHPAVRLDEFLQLNDSSTPEHQRQKASAWLATESPTRWNPKNGTEHSSATSPSSMELAMLPRIAMNQVDDPIYRATVQVVKTVRVASQQLMSATPETYALLAKSIGAAVKDLLTAVHTHFSSESIINEIFLAERQVNASMFHLISTIKDATLATNRGPLLEEFRRHLMTLCYAVANDAHSLYSAVHDCRLRNSDGRNCHT
ncbi:hypothetical protein CRM22_005195 [Opisthorchis felineus]|uniref:non-specific protein-tyrosine kinase n=1 Tax=Opisthorchis felineus TaxID=147828 RepID=A0A4S2LY13_OPIFE|nr:hypothetical protein CRM22_005195 [Opisthorchis felineus]